jgi:hypothetical protein
MRVLLLSLAVACLAACAPLPKGDGPPPVGQLTDNGHGAFLVDSTGCLISPEVSHMRRDAHLVVFQRYCRGDARFTTNVSILGDYKTMPMKPGNIIVVDDPTKKGRADYAKVTADFEFSDTMSIRVIYHESARVLQRDSVVAGYRVHFRVWDATGTRPAP